ncbi:hypothetical protein V6246_00700 [Algibacter sp. TI.3.09]|uniref:hypothetical protein n=1 Tax=Algibacter sp. TI.3.09 TaxID=3121298 RepID=UPI00311EF299
MKKVLLITFILSFCYSYSQNVGDLFTSKSASIPITFVKTFDSKADTTSHSDFLIPYIRYEITGTTAGFIEFSVKRLVENAPSAKVLNYKIYKMSSSDYTNRTKPANGKEILRFGALALPLKLRSSDGEINFETDLNVNFALAIRLNESFINDWDLTWQLGFGFGSTDLTSTNSSIEQGKDQSVQILTGLTGLNLNFKGIQIGLYTGVDYINNQSQYNWKYNGNMFLSAGIGFNIFGGQPKGEQDKL